MSENQAMGVEPRYKTPPMPQGEASVTTVRRSAEAGRSKEYVRTMAAASRAKKVESHSVAERTRRGCRRAGG
eukprot:1412305-Lingulodinium_polyedra.AAC.1